MNTEDFRFEDLKNWHEAKDFLETSGRSEKIWLTNDYENTLALFKYPKSESTYEHIAEHLACEIGKLLHIPCSKIELGYFQGRKGSLSYLVHDINNEILVEGVNFLQVQFPNYDSEKLIDPDSNQVYSVEMIRSSLIDNSLRHQFMYILLFDFIIGNSDRHQNNWALIYNLKGRFRLSPLYDNGSSLCSYVPEEKIADILNDSMRFNALVDTKSRSRIGLIDKRKPCHSEIMRYIIRNNYISIYDIKRITKNLKNSIPFVLYRYKNILSENRIKLLNLFISAKIDILNNICREEEYINE